MLYKITHIITVMRIFKLCPELPWRSLKERGRHKHWTLKCLPCFHNSTSADFYLFYVLSLRARCYLRFSLLLFERVCKTLNYNHT